MNLDCSKFVITQYTRKLSEFYGVLFEWPSDLGYHNLHGTAIKDRINVARSRQNNTQIQPYMSEFYGVL